MIAVGIGAATLLGGSSAAHAQFVKAVPGSISILGQAVSGSTATSLTLAFTVGGQISDVNVAVGDAVKKGDVLAALDPQSTAGGLTQAKAAYDAASAAYQKVVNGATGPAIDAARAAVNMANRRARPGDQPAAGSRG